MKPIITALCFLLPAVSFAATAESADTAQVLGEIVVMETAAKAPVPLLPSMLK